MKMSNISEQRRNILFGVLNRTFSEVGKTLADPTIVFSLFVRQLGASNLLVGLLSTIRYAGWFLPQVFVGGHLQHQARRGFVYVIGEGSRCLGYLVLAILILVFPTSRWLLPMFFTIFAISYLGHGTGSVPRFDVIGRAVPASMRGSFFARSNLIAGVFGFGAGFVVQAILRSSGSGPPVQRYAVLILLSIVFYLLSIDMFRRICEHDSPIQEGKASIQGTLRAIPPLLRRDSNYRRLVITLMLTDAARRLIDPFYIIFATEVLGVPIYYAGIYLSVLIFSKILSNVFWDLLSRWVDNRRTLQLAAAASLLVPGMAFLFATFSQHGASGNGWVFAAVFVMMGIRDSGKHIGKRSVFLDTVVEEERPIRWGTLNSMLGIVSFLPVLAGTLIDGIGYTITFALVAVVSLFGLWSSLRIQPIPTNNKRCCRMTQPLRETPKTRPWVVSLTYPKGFAAHVQPFTFAIISDPHCDETPSSARHSRGLEHLGDGTDRLRLCFDAIRSMDESDKPSFLMLLGDIGMDRAVPVLADAPCPVHAVAGNHDWGAKRQRLRELFPEDFGTGEQTSDYYRFEYRGVIFVAICNAGIRNEHTGQLSSEDIHPPGQPSWIAQQLAQSKRPTVLLGHCPPQPDGFNSREYLSVANRRYLPYMGECDSKFLNDVLASRRSIAAFFGHLHRATFHYPVDTSSVHVLRSSNWNHDHEPIGFAQVRVSPTGISVREILTGTNTLRA